MAALGVKYQPLDDGSTNASIDPSNPASATSTPKISLSLGSKKISQPVHAKRSRSMLEEHNIEEQEYDQAEILQFGGAPLSIKPETSVRIIQAQPNRDWREESRRKRQKSSLPIHQQPGVNGAANSNHDVVNGNGLSYGLIKPKLEEASESKEEDETPDKARSSQPSLSAKTEDDLAMDALLGKTKISTSIIAPASPPPTEDAVFRIAFDNAPPMATLDQYAAMPVEEFGAALLRGQGWKDGEAIGRQRHSASKQKERVVAKRPALLGLGAKESGIGIELGAWGKGAKMGSGKSGKRAEDMNYNPVMRRNKTTGEMLTDEELKEKLEMQKSSVAHSGYEARHYISRSEYQSEEDSRRNSSRRREKESGSERGWKTDDYERLDRKQNHDRIPSSRKKQDIFMNGRHRQRSYDDEDDGYRERRDKGHRRHGKGGDQSHNFSSRRDRRDRELARDSLDRRR